METNLLMFFSKLLMFFKKTVMYFSKIIVFFYSGARIMFFYLLTSFFGREVCQKPKLSVILTTVGRKNLENATVCIQFLRHFVPQDDKTTHPFTFDTLSPKSCVFYFTIKSFVALLPEAEWNSLYRQRSLLSLSSPACRFQKQRYSVVASFALCCRE